MIPPRLLPLDILAAVEHEEWERRNKLITDSSTPLMYFPDLESVQNCAKVMMRNKGKEYKGIYPQTQEQLPQARKELGAYLRTHGDDVRALSVELAATEDNFHSLIGKDFIQAVIEAGGFNTT